jgi:hypothetical protein
MMVRRIWTLQVSLSKGYGKNIVECSLWEWKGLTQDEGDEVADWLSSFLDKKVRLVRYLGDSLQLPWDRPPSCQACPFGVDNAPPTATASCQACPFGVDNAPPTD